MSLPITVTVNNITMTSRDVMKKADISRDAALNRIRLFKLGKITSQQLLSTKNIHRPKREGGLTEITIQQFRAKQASLEVMA